MKTVQYVILQSKAVVCQDLKFQIFDNVTPCRLIRSYRRCEGLQRVYLQCQGLFLDPLAPQMMAGISFEILVTIYQSTQCNSHKDLNIQKYRCESLECPNVIRVLQCEVLIFR